VITVGAPPSEQPHRVEIAPTAPSGYYGKSRTYYFDWLDICSTLVQRKNVGNLGVLVLPGLVPVNTKKRASTNDDLADRYSGMMRKKRKIMNALAGDAQPMKTRERKNMNKLICLTDTFLAYSKRHPLSKFRFHVPQSRLLISALKTFYEIS
jgi:hypothetical protein